MMEVGCQCIMQCQNSRSYAGAAPRIGAYLVDKVCVAVIVGMVAGIMGILSALGLDFITKDKVLFQYTIYAIVLYIIEKAYFVLFATATGQTPGKMLFRLKIVNEDGSKTSFWNMLYREVIGRYLAGLPIFAWVGYLMIIPDQEKRGLHDRLCDTRVIYDEQVNNEKDINNLKNEDDLHRLFDIDDNDASIKKEASDILSEYEAEEKLLHTSDVVEEKSSQLSDTVEEKIVETDETVETIIQSAEEMQSKIDDMSKDIDEIINNTSNKEE